MSKMWDDLKKNMKDWSAAAVEKAEEVSKIAVAKTEELTKISKVKIEIHQLQRDRSKSFEKIGKSVFEHFQSKKSLKISDIDSMQSLFDDIGQLSDSIVAKELEIQKIKEENDLADEDVKEAEVIAEEIVENIEKKVEPESEK